MENLELINKYYHIDNGGLTVELSARNNGDNKYFLERLTFSNSFYGYTSNTMTFHMLHIDDKNNTRILRDLGSKLIAAADEIDKLNKL